MTRASLSGQLRSAARAGRERLRRILSRRREVKVRFPSDREIFAALRTDMPDLAQAQAAARAGDLDRARRHLMTHLGARSEPRFFVDTAEIRPLAARLASLRPEWHAAAMRSASEWMRHLYPAGQLPNGGEHFPEWNKLPLGPGDDTVYRYKAHYFLFAAQLARARTYGAASDVLLKRLIESWLASTDGRAHASGYSSPLIAVHRAVALTWTLAFLASCEQRDIGLEFTILRILLADARFVYARLGTSVPNNHLLADGFLMAYLGLLYPEFRDAEQWKRDGDALFLRELQRQVYEDGTSFEHSVHYHELVCEMVTGYVLLARRNGIAIAPWVEQRHRRMLEFQAALGGPEARTFDIGDTVEGHLFPLDAFDGVGAAVHREILRALYDPAFPPSRADAPGLERAHWLLGRSFEAPTGDSADRTSFAFPNGGYVVLPDAELDGCVVFRTGPGPQELCNPGHMHADLLSIYVRLRKTPIIVDAGTFTYRSRKAQRWPAEEPAWRAHFMSPAAHNTLCIEGHDPLDRGPGDFPSGSPRSRAVGRPLITGADMAWTEATIVSDAAYGGYTRGLVHVRGRYWLVYDVLPETAIAGNAWLGLQFAHETSVRKQGDSALAVTLPAANLLVASTQGPQGWDVVQGLRTPLAGWVSPRYGEAFAAPAGRLATTGGAHIAATVLEPFAEDTAAPTIEVERTDDRVIAVRITMERVVDYVLLSRDGEGRRASGFGIDFEGTALWLRVADGRPNELRVLAGRKASSASFGFSVAGALGPRNLRLIFGQDARHGLSPDESDIEVIVQ